MTAALVAVVCLFAVLCSGSALCCALGRGSFEDVLPLTCTVIVAVGFVFGVAGLLNAGFFVLLFAAVAALIAAAVAAGRGHGFSARFFTPGFFLFAAVYALLLFFNYGTFLRSWDEFSHWGDVVKVMTTLGAFGTHPLSESMFPAYPPAMALFQFFAEKLYMLVSGEEMAEWLLFFAYQVLLSSLYFPFLRRMGLKKPGTWVLAVLLWLLPMVFQRNAYGKIYIDSFLSALLGVGLAGTFAAREGDAFARWQLAAVLLLLPLTKSLGLAFALVVLAVLLFSGRAERVRPFVLGCAGATAMGWAAWTLHAKLRGASNAVGPSAAIAAEHVGDSAYAMGIFRSFLSALVRRPLTNEEAIFPQLPALAVLVLLMAALWLLLRAERRINGDDRSYTRAFWVVFAANGLFCAALCVGYMFFYPDFEAAKLLGMERYLNNIFMADTVFALLLAGDLLRRDAVSQRALVAAVTAAVLLFTPMRTVGRFVLRREAAAAQQERARYTPYIDAVKERTGGEPCSVLFATDDPWNDANALDYMLFRTVLRPCHVEMLPLPEELSRYDYIVVYDMASPPEGTENGGVYAVAEISK